MIPCRHDYRIKPALGDFRARATARRAKIMENFLKPRPKKTRGVQDTTMGHAQRVKDSERKIRQKAVQCHVAACAMMPTTRVTSLYISLSETGTRELIEWKAERASARHFITLHAPRSHIAGKQ